MAQVKFVNHEAELRKLALAYVSKHYCADATGMRTEIFTRFNALMYRSRSVLWNHSQLDTLIKSTCMKIVNHSDRNDIVPDVMSSLFLTSYCFDDIIFNLVSMFDYLSGLTGLVITGEASKWYKWNQLIKIVRNDNKGYPKTAKELLNQHRVWVDKLAGYRGGVYHKKSDMGSAEHTVDPKTGMDSVMFFVPEQAVKNMPCFGKDEKAELFAGTEAIIETSFDIQKAVLTACLCERE